MSKKKIVVFGDPVLETKAANVTEFGEELARFVADMHNTMIEANGVGLAAPQIGVSKQIAIVDISVGKEPDSLKVLINPEVLEADGKEKGEEGCLSFPDIVTVVERATHVKVRCQNVTGDTIILEAHDFEARAFLHEIDHLNGVLMTERISQLKRNMIKKKVHKRVKEGTWA